MSRVLISAAHTETAPGEVFDGLREVDLTRKIVTKLVKELESRKIEHQAVPLDMMIFDRIDWINDTGYTEEKGDLMIEIHVNDGNKRGLEAWYQGDDEDGNKAKEFAEYLTKEIEAKNKNDYKIQGVKSEKDHEFGALAILSQTNTISIAIECFYIDNEEDRKILKDEKKLEEFSKVFADSLKKYLDTGLAKKPGKKKEKKLPTMPPLGGGLFGGNGLLDDPLDISPPPQTSSSTSNALMSREDRKKMIEETYEKMMGKTPNQMELNTLLNMAISKENLIIRIMDSEDYKKFVEDAKQFSEMKNKTLGLESDLASLKGKLQDTEALLNSQNKLLVHKNEYIKTLQAELEKNGITKPGERINYEPQFTLPQAHTNQPPQMIPQRPQAPPQMPPRQQPTQPYPQR